MVRLSRLGAAIVLLTACFGCGNNAGTTSSARSNPPYSVKSPDTKAEAPTTTEATDTAKSTATAKEGTGGSTISKWKEFSPSDGAFSVLMPDAESSDYDVLGSILTKMRLVRLPGEDTKILIVSYGKLAEGVGIDFKKEFDGAVINFPRGNKGALSIDREYAIEGGKGREYQMDGKGKNATSGRLFTLNGYGYELIVSGESMTLDNPDVQKFMGSFKPKK